MRRIRKSFTDEAGNRHFVRGKTEAEIDGKIAVLKYQIEKGEQVVSSNMKVAVWADKWLTTYKQNNVSPTWYKDMCAIVQNRIIDEYGQVRLKDFKPLHAQKILNAMSGYSESYIKKVHDILNEMFECAVDNNLVFKNPIKGVTMPSTKPAEERRAFTRHETELLLKVLPAHRGNLLCKLMLYCGLRPGEVCALRWTDIDLNNARITVNKATKKDGTIGSTKSKAGIRTVPIPEVFLEELRSIKHEPFSLVCTQLNGNMHTKSSLRKLWQSVKKEMDIENGAEVYRSAVVQTTLNEPLVIYDLRHTYCTNLQAMGVPIDVARRLMGHSSIELTSRIYTHESEEVLENVTKLMNKKIKRPAL